VVVILVALALNSQEAHRHQQHGAGEILEQHRLSVQELMVLDDF